MNKALIMGCAVLMAATLSCARQESGPMKEQRLVTLTATAERGVETRTVRHPDETGASSQWDTYWMPADEVSVFYGSGSNGGSRFVSQNDEPVYITNFTGTIGVITGGNDISVEDTYFWGLYPYDPTSSCNGTIVTTTVKTQQVATTDTFPDDTFVSLGRSPGLNMGFFNVCSGIKFYINTEGVKSVTLRGNNGEKFAGKIVVGFDDDGRPVVQDDSEGATEVVMTAPDGGDFEVGKAYYMVTIPKVFTGGFTLRLDTRNKYAEKVYSSKITLKRSIFGALSQTMDQGLTWINKGVPFEDEGFEAYMTGRFDTDGDGMLSPEEAAAVQTLKLDPTDTADPAAAACFNGREVSLAGLEYFIGLKQLRITECNVKDLDIAPMTGLQLLSINSMAGLGWKAGVSAAGFSNLRYLHIENSLDGIDILSCPNLENLIVHGAMLPSDLSSLTKLLSFESRELVDPMPARTLKLAGSSLQYVTCHSGVTSLDVTGCPALLVLSCQADDFATIDLSHNPALEDLNINSCHLTSIDLSVNTSLKEVNFYNNALTSVDLSGLSQLKHFDCQFNQLTELNLAGNLELDDLSCNSNQLTVLDVSKNTALRFLSCSDNLLTSLNVSKLTALQVLFCANMPTLQYLYIAKDQVIPDVTENRSEYHIPSTTVILTDSTTGGNEGTGEEPIG